VSIWPADDGGPAGPSREEQARGLCFSFLYDLCAWLAGAREPVPPEVREYSLGQLRGAADPRQRLQYYVHPHLLASWEQALRPYFAARLRLDPEIGPSVIQRSDGLNGNGPARVEYRFENRCALLAQGGGRQSMPPAPWVLTLWMTADLQRVDDGTLRPLASA
jgi:hypothetical protein